MTLSHIAHLIHKLTLSSIPSNYIWILTIFHLSHCHCPAPKWIISTAPNCLPTLTFAISLQCILNSQNDPIKIQPIAFNTYT